MQLRDDLLSMLVAGHETTGSVLTWTVYLLSKVWIKWSFSSLYGKQSPGFQLSVVDLNGVIHCDSLVLIAKLCATPQSCVLLSDVWFNAISTER